jgi:hypothetical protein
MDEFNSSIAVILYCTALTFSEPNVIYNVSFARKDSPAMLTNLINSSNLTLK